VRKLCPKCEELLKVADDGTAHCNGCGWSGPASTARREPSLPATPPKMPYVSIDIETTGLNHETCQTLEVGAVIDDWKTPIDQLPRFRRVLVYDTVSGNPYAMALNAALLKFMANAPKDPPQPAHEAVATWAEKCAITRPLDSAVLTLAIDNQPINWWNIPNKLLVGGLQPAIRESLIDLAANPPGTSCFCQPCELAFLFRSWIVMNGLDPLSLQAAGKNFASFDMQFLYWLPNFTEAVRFRHRVLDPAILFWRPLEDDRLPDSKTCYERAGIGSKVAHTAVEDALAVVRLVRMGVKRLEGMN
jgi:hypothetical protein